MNRTFSITVIALFLSLLLIVVGGCCIRFGCWGRRCGKISSSCTSRRKRKLAGKIGAGEGTLYLETHNGSITIKEQK